MYKKYAVHSLGRTTIAISNETKKRFIKARGAMEIKNGKHRSEEDVLNELLNVFERNENGGIQHRKLA